MARKLNDGPRIAEEMTTVSAMIDVYCRTEHRGAGRRRPQYRSADQGTSRDTDSGTAGACRDCEGLRTYALRRLELCRYGEDKPTCKNCPTHCYRHDRREAIREVMVKAGPRMLWHRPVLAVKHLVKQARTRSR